MRSPTQQLRAELREEYLPPPPGIYACPNCGGDPTGPHGTLPLMGERLDPLVEGAPCDYCRATGSVTVFLDGAIHAGTAGGPLRGVSPLRRLRSEA